MSRAVVLSLPLLVVLTGCGGGKKGGSSSGQAEAGVRIEWPAVGRTLRAPGSARSANVEFMAKGSSNPLASLVAARPEGIEASTLAYPVPNSLPPGRYTMTAHFVTNRDGSGDETATTTVEVRVGKGGSLSRSDGSALGTIGFVGKIASVSVLAGQRVDLGRDKTLSFEADDANGHPVALSTDPATVSVVSGGDHLQAEPGAKVRGLAAGDGTVTLSVDGVSSAPVVVVVNGGAIVPREVTAAVNSIVTDPTRDRLWASLDEGTVVDVNPSSGTQGTAISVGPHPGTLGLTDDGSTLFVGLNTSASVVSVDLASRVAGSPFSFAATFGGAYPFRIVPAPGSNRTVAVSVAGGGMAIFDDGVVRPKRLGLYEGSLAVWTSTSHLVAFDANGSEGKLVSANVGADGLTATQTIVGGFDEFSVGLTLFEGKLYGTHGIVVDAATLAPLAGYPNPRSSLFYNEDAGPVIDKARNRLYFIQLGGTPQIVVPPRLKVFRLDDGALLSDRPIANVSDYYDWYPNENPCFVGWGSDGLAFRTPDRIVLIDHASTL